MNKKAEIKLQYIAIGVAIVIIFNIFLVWNGNIVLTPKPIDYSKDMSTIAMSSDDIPITTWEDAFSLAINKFQSEEIWECNASNMEGFWMLNGSIQHDEYGNYGYKTTTCAGWLDERENVTHTSTNTNSNGIDKESMIWQYEERQCMDTPSMKWISEMEQKQTARATRCNRSTIVGYIMLFECKLIDEWYPDGTPAGGKVGLDFRFDPNNGFIYQLMCNYIRYDNCPVKEHIDTVDAIYPDRLHVNVTYANGTIGTNVDSNETYVRIYNWMDKNPRYSEYRAINYTR